MAALTGQFSITTPANAASIADHATTVGHSTAQAYTTLNFTGRYAIRNASGKCLEIAGSSSSNGARAQQWDCLGQPGMYWRISNDPTGYNIIQNNSSNKCLEIENSSNLLGAHAQQWDCLGQTGSLWISGATIVNYSGGCLEIENSSSSNGAGAQQWNCVGQSGAKWTLLPIDSSCGEPICTPVQQGYLSHYTGLGCTGTESYYTPYFGNDGIRRSWDGNGNAGTILRTVTNRSARTSSGQCTDYWPAGNTLTGFVTIYR